MKLVYFGVVFLGALVPGAAFAEWGTIHGRLVYDGEPPQAKSVRVSKDQDVFGETLPDESLVVNSENGGVANILVYLLPDADQPLRVHPSYEATADAKVELTAKNGRFEPHVLLLRTTQTLVQRNRDRVGHHANISWIQNAPS